MNFSSPYLDDWAKSERGGMAHRDSMWRGTLFLPLPRRGEGRGRESRFVMFPSGSITRRIQLNKYCVLPSKDRRFHTLTARLQGLTTVLHHGSSRRVVGYPFHVLLRTATGRVGFLESRCFAEGRDVPLRHLLCFAAVLDAVGSFVFFGAGPPSRLLHGTSHASNFLPLSRYLQTKSQSPREPEVQSA